jgi:pimeloyl-ACP methyl ester carboxylesterase
MINMPQEKIFSTKATQLNYLDWGPSSAEPLVMLHGGAWSWQEYLSLIPTLAQRGHVYALDFRGNGRSGWVQEMYRLQDFVEDCSQFLRELPAPAVLAGHSLGGVVALLLSAQCADRVKALVLEDSPVMREKYRQIIQSSQDTFGVWLELKKQAQSEQEPALLLAQEFKAYSGATSSWLLFFAKCLRQLDPTFFNVMLRDFGGFAAGYNGQQLLKEISCPVLCLRGEPRLGAVMTDEEISWVQGTCQNVRCVQIGAVGHLLHLESQGQMPVLTAIMDFLAEPRAASNGGSAVPSVVSRAAKGPRHR